MYLPPPPPLSLQTSIDILTTVVRNTKAPLSEMLVCQAFPVVAQCTLRTEDNAIMQVNDPPHTHTHTSTLIQPSICLLDYMMNHEE